MKWRLPAILVTPILLMMGLLAAAQNGAQQSRSKSQATVPQTPKTTRSQGEQEFQTNCGRCHNAPEQLSPREVRAVLRQMRVRAMLTAEQEKSIREYLAP